MRPGAGRPPRGEKAGVPHRPRPELTGREPVLVTMKVRAGITSLRGRSAFDRVLRSLRRVRAELGAHVTHYSVQRDHVHLIVEAEDMRALSRGMQGLAVRIARGVNRAMNRKGAVFADRFHDRVLRSPRQVRNALSYVLCNARKHGLAPRQRGWLDPHSSAWAFDGWASTTHAPSTSDSVSPPRTWLLRVGWRRGGLLEVDHRPGTLS
jgi:REP element-mobilizing transposase RayT